MSELDLKSVAYAAGDGEVRPWGRWDVLAVGDGYAVKRVRVIPGGRISLQYHRRRTEHWTVVEGVADVEIDGAVTRLSVGGQATVPVLVHHRISNPGDRDLVFVEIQMGRALDEADIVRLSDDYGRAPA